MIQVENLTRFYGDFLAVNEISFEIPKGQIVGLLGHNGAGKTTTLKMLTGFLEPSSGKILIDGNDIEENCLDIQKTIGYLPENSPLYPEMTVLEYLKYVAELRNIPKSEQNIHIKEAIEKTKLQEKATSLINTLSKGFKQRVGVAQAILHKPNILILDEPTNGLDPTQILEMRQLIKSLSKEATVILSTHILQEVDAICDRVIIIHGGKIAKDATLNDLKSTSSITLRVQGPTTEVKTNIKKINGVTSIICVSEQKSGNIFRVEVEKHWNEISPDVARAVNKYGWPLIELRPTSINLEAVFREINSQTQGV